MPVLLGVNAGAVLTPIGSLANLLWLRTMRAHGLAGRLERGAGDRGAPWAARRSWPAWRCWPCSGALGG